MQAFCFGLFTADVDAIFQAQQFEHKATNAPVCFAAFWLQSLHARLHLFVNRHPQTYTHRHQARPRSETDRCVSGGWGCKFCDSKKRFLGSDMCTTVRKTHEQRLLRHVESNEDSVVSLTRKPRHSNWEVLSAK